MVQKQEQKEKPKGYNPASYKLHLYISYCIYIQLMSMFFGEFVWSGSH